MIMPIPGMDRRALIMALVIALLLDLIVIGFAIGLWRLIDA